MPDNKDTPESQSVEYHSESLEAGLSPVDTLPYRLGFEESQALLEARAEILSVIIEAKGGELTAWVSYQELAEAQIDALDDSEGKYARAQIGLLIAKASIWREAGVTINYLKGLVDANEYAANMGFADVTRVLEPELARYVASGEMLEIEGQLDQALDSYIEREQEPDLTDTERGRLNLRMAYCYLGLIKQGAGEAGELSELLDGSLQSALAYFEGTPEQNKALRLLEELEKDQA